MNLCRDRGHTNCHYFCLALLFFLIFLFMLKRAIILSESDAKKIFSASAEPISLYVLSRLDVHFALSYVRNRKINEILRKYFKFYIVSMIDFYEYKEGDRILFVRLDDENLQLYLLKLFSPPSLKVLVI